MKAVIPVLGFCFVSSVLLGAVPGDTFSSQKTAYNDPYSGKSAWRLTTWGKTNNVRITLGGDVSGESTQWSADSTRITFSLDHPSHGKALYMMNVSTGVITYLASTGTAPSESMFSRANANEILYFYHNQTGSTSTSWVELRAVNLTTFAHRVIRRYNKAYNTIKLCHSYDGKYLKFTIYQGHDEASRIWQPVINNILTGNDHPAFTYNENFTFTDQGAVFNDGVYFNPVVHHKVLLIRPTSSTNAVTEYYNLNTSSGIAFNFWTAHTTWHPDGTRIAGDLGIKSDAGACLTPTCGSSTLYRTTGHPFSDPTDIGLAWNARLTTDDRQSNNGSSGNSYIYAMTWDRIRTQTWSTIAGNPGANAIGTWFGNYDGGNHPHMHVSPNGKHLVWRSNLRRVSALGAPPGPTDANATSSDLFMLQLKNYVKNLNVLDSANAADWSLREVLMPGDMQYGDRTFTWLTIPGAYQGSTWIRAAADSKSFAGNVATFTTGAAVDVFVAVDTRVSPLPSWLSTYTSTGQTLVAQQGSFTQGYNVYKKAFANNVTVTLGAPQASAASMYTVFVRKQSGTPVY